MAGLMSKLWGGRRATPGGTDLIDANCTDRSGLLPRCNIRHSLNRAHLMYYAALARGAELLTAHCPLLTDL